MTSLQSTAMIAAALASITGCYAISLQASGERTAIATARATIGRDLSDLRLLRAELRTRSRLPELQRWNEQVLALAPPRAEQLVADTVTLASYAGPGPAAAAPAVTAAVLRDAPLPSPAVHRISSAELVAGDLGADAARAGGGATLAVSYQKIALR